MIKIEFQKNSQRSYMIISTDSYEEDAEQEILRQHAVKNLLSFYQVEVEEGTQIWYDITHLTSVKDLMKTGNSVCDMADRVSDALDMLSKRYLIRKDSIYFTPETAFTDAAGTIYFAYLPVKGGRDTADDVAAFKKSVKAGRCRAISAYDTTYRVAEKLAEDALSRVAAKDKALLREIAEKINEKLLSGEFVGKDTDIFNPDLYLNIARKAVYERKLPSFACNLSAEEAELLEKEKPFEGADENTDPRRGGTYLEVPDTIDIELNICFDENGIGHPAYYICVCDKDGWRSDGYADEFMSDAEAAPDMRFIRFGESGWKNRLCQNMEEVLRRVMLVKGLDPLKAFADGKIIRK